MIIIGLSDIHNDTTNLEKIRDPLSNADLVVLSGDITHFGHTPEATRVVEAVMDINPKVIAVSGNCDYPEVDHILNQKKINIHAAGTVIGDIGFMGVAGSLTTPFNTPNEMTENDIKNILEKGISDLPNTIPFILVSHQPPINTSCDRLRTGDHVGSTAVRQFILDYQPLICFTGHIHESENIDTIGKTRVVNPGQFRRGGYAFANITMDNTIPDAEVTIKKMTPLSL